MALSVNIQNEENSFVVQAVIKSDNIIDLRSKMQTDAFRIDIADKLYALSNADSVKNDLEELKSPDITDERRAELNAEITEYESDIGTPIITIDKSNFQRYLNYDNESLIANGVQLQVYDDTMIIRFAPIQHAIPFKDDYVSLNILFCVVGFDFDELEITNRKSFDVCLLPRLITGNVEKEIPSEADPILPNSANRADYQFNGPENVNNLYVNNGENAVPAQKVPLYVVKTSAFTTDEISLITNETIDFEWNTLESTLIDDSTNTYIDLPFTVNGASAVDVISAVEPTTAMIINDPSIQSTYNTLTGVKIYEIIQKIETSGTETYLKDKVKLSVNV